MKGDRDFQFFFEVSHKFLVESPVAQQYVEIAKARIANQRSIVGPRGGLYRLVTPPDEWVEDRTYWWDRNRVLFGTRRAGRYVRPDRVTPDLRLSDDVTFDTLTTPVVEGLAVLPSGNTIETPSRFVSFPVILR